MKTSMPPAASSAPIPRLSADEEIALVTRAQAGDRGASNALARAHEPYMRRVSIKFARKMGADRQDYLGACFVGFMLALARFDVTRGVRFLTYASWWFNHEMQRMSEGSNLFGHVPSGSEEKAIAAIGRLHTYDADLLAVEAGVKRSTAVSAVTVYCGRAVGLDTRYRCLSGDDSSGLEERLADEEALTPEEQLEMAEEQEEQRIAVAQAMRTIDPRERAIVQESVMAEKDEQKSLAELGRHYGVSRERMRQVAINAKRKLASAISERMAQQMSEGRVAA
jgi:RNA polymerase sigma factor (sigma-70 family)